MVGGVFGQIGGRVQSRVMGDNREELEHVQTHPRLVGEPPVWEKMYSSSHATNNHVKVYTRIFSTFQDFLPALVITLLCIE